MTDIFISHIHEEAELAKLIKNWIEDTFLGQVSVFVSADDRDIKLGDEWFQTISAALESSLITLLLCSPISVTRPWISFEAGWGWAKNVPIAPICHSGLLPSALPKPFDFRQAINIEDKSAITKLIQAIARHRNFAKVPRIAENEFEAELKKVLEFSKPASSSSKVSTTMSPSLDIEFDDERIKILSFLEKTDDSHHDETICRSTGVNKSLVKILISRLLDEDLVGQTLIMNQPIKYYLSDVGREYLLKRGVLNF